MPKTNKKSGFLQTSPHFNWGSLGVVATFGLNRRLLKAGLLACFMLAFSMQVALAQERTISGKVVGADGLGVPAISVYVKGTSKGTITDGEGNFQLAVPQGAVLVVQGVGYKNTEVTVGSESTVSISVEEDVTSLNEVVINSGYTVDSRRETAGAISTVQAKDVAIVPSGNVEQQLQGRVAGVTVITNGQPGTTSQIRVRGFGSFENNEPLYVVDGVPVGSTDFLNPDDIEDITVLKDAAAASIYGARASSGVVIYTTKRGKKGAKKLSITYDALFGSTSPGKGQSMMNPTDFAEWTRNAYINSGITTPHPQFGTVANWRIPDYINVGGNSGITGTLDLAAERLRYNVDPDKGGIYQVVAANKSGTDWYKAITRNAPVMRHTLGISGGGENNRFYVGMSMQDQKGILLSNSFKRYAFRVNTEFDILKNLRVGQNLQFTYRQVLGLAGGNGGQGVAADENDILTAFRMPSIIPVYDVFGGYAGTAAKGFNNPRNPVAARDRIADNRGFNLSGFGNVYLEYEPIKDLVIRTSIGGNYGGYAYRGYSPPQYENSENQGAYVLSEGSGYGFGWTFTNTITYKKKIDKHAINVLVGQEALNTGVGRNIDGSGLNPFSYDVNYVTLNTVSTRQVFGGQFRGVNFSSYFGQVRYTFDDKYILTGVIRRDGSSRFGANNRYGVFPAISAAWRISSENFMKSLTWISDLKIRGGYGTMGNSNAVSPTNQFTLYSTSFGQSSYDLGGTNTGTFEGYFRSQVGNPDAKWETNITSNIGFDGTFLKGKLEVIVDFWQKKTKDLLVRLPLPATSGFQGTAPYVNSASMVNRGLDIQIITRGRVSEVSYELTANGSFLHNEITSIKEGLTYLTTIDPSFRGITPIRNQLGYSLSAFYGFKVLGLFANAAEVTGAPTQAGAGPGRFRFADINGDNVIDQNDRTFLGSPVPKFTGGVNFQVKYKNFEVNCYMYTSIGNKIFNQSKWFTDFYPSFAGAAISNRVKDSWTPQNTGATIPVFENVSNFSTNTQANSFYVEDGSYLRMQNLSIAYNIPLSVLSKIKLEKLRIFAGANNLFTITGYKGLDPGVGGNADTAFGIDIGNYPITRSFTFGFNLGF